MIDLETLFEKHNLDRERFDWATHHLNELNAICEDYEGFREKLHPLASYLADVLRQGGDKVHSIRFRLKDPEHLIVKIIRKEDRVPIDRSNYRVRIKDLIGLRALHLFKEDWVYIDEYIRAKWRLAENPTASVRKGDREELIEDFKKAGCKIREHKAGYRSVHYLIRTQLDKETQVAEIQVRTIFEEGWSEIDHLIRYPDNLTTERNEGLLGILNKHAGSADDLGSFIRDIQEEYLGDRQVPRSGRATQMLAKQRNERVDRMNIEKKEKSYIKQGLEDLDKSAREESLPKESAGKFSQANPPSRHSQMIKEVFFGRVDDSKD
ncbi:MAG: RelA/SpoT domain-containing protein [Acidobacteriota bacterium]